MPVSPSKKQPESREAISLVHDRLASFCGDDERLGKLLALSVGRVLLKAVRQGADVRRAASDTQLGHVADWLKAAIANDDPWLYRCDEHDRPKKLMKFSTVEDIVREADRHMLKAAQRHATVSLVEGDEALFAELGDGYRIVRLLTPSALDRESAEMQHCIGNGGYDGNLGTATAFYLSLRDAAGKAHITLEVIDGYIVQLQGKQNEPPLTKYLDRLVPFIETHGYQVFTEVYYSGRVLDIHGRLHSITAMPDGLATAGDLFLAQTDIAVLPRGLSVGGSLDVTCTPLESLPDGLTVGGNLHVANTKMKALPDGLSVGGDLDLDETTFITLPEGLTVGGSLDLEGTAITVLPNGLSVGGSLFLRGSRIRTLPEGLIVGGELFLHGTYISALPASISDETLVHTDGFPHNVTMTAKDFRHRNEFPDRTEGPRPGSTGL